MNILGISAFYHDSAACLVQDGHIASAAQEERFSRIKHDDSFPVNAINYCLESSGLTSDSIDYIAFYDKPFLKFDRIIQTYLTYAPLGLKSFLKSIPLWIKKKIWLKDLIQKQLDFENNIIFPEHHMSHAASAFFPSPFEEAAFLTIDGVGEWATTCYGVGKGNKIKITADIKFPHSLGLLYSAFTYYTGFKVNSGEYKMMGLAPYGNPIYKDIILKELIDIKDDGSFKMNMEYFNYCAGLTMTSKKFHRLFNDEPRKPESKITQKVIDLSRSIQEATEEIILRMANHLRQETGQKQLCLSGGVALNCVANGKLLREKIFDDIWIQPAAGDAGGALGAAMYTWHQHLDKKRVVAGANDMMGGAYLGPAFDDTEVENYLKSKQIPHEKFDKEALVSRAAELISSGKVIGWFQGRMEFGPRALGARSILGDARSPGMQSIINLKIKFREGFRPFAPSVLAEKSSEYFDIGGESPYMLITGPVRDEIRKEIPLEEQQYDGLDKLKLIRSEIPAVTHVDYSARVQTVHKETNPLYHRLISEFDKKNKCGVIINTSFNVRGEPIVCTPRDAYNCFMHTNMDYLVMENYILDKDEILNSEAHIDWGS